MKSKTILGADGATKMRQITVGIHGKGGEAGIKAILWQEMNRHGQRHNRKRVKRHEKGLYMQPIQGERRRRAGQKHRLCAAADTAGVRGGLSTHYAAFIYDAVHGR